MSSVSILSLILGLVNSDGYGLPPGPPLVSYARGEVSTIDLNCNSHSGSLTVPLNGNGVIFFRPNKGENIRYEIYIQDSTRIHIELGFGLYDIECSSYAPCVVNIPASAFDPYYKSYGYRGPYQPRIPAIVTVKNPRRRLASPSYYEPRDPVIIIDKIQCIGKRYKAPEYGSGSYTGKGGEGPKHEGPTYEGPTYEGPTYEGPTYEGPKYEGPKYEGPKHEGPKYEGPKHEEPKHEGPKHEGPKHEGPKHEGPKHEGPKHGGYSSSGAPLVSYARGGVSTIDLNCYSHSGSLEIPLNGQGVIYFRPSKNYGYQYHIYIPNGEKIHIERGFGLPPVNCDGYSPCIVTIPESKYSPYYSSYSYSYGRDLRIPAIVTVKQPPKYGATRRLAGYYKPTTTVIIIDKIQCIPPRSRYGASW